LPFPIEGEVLPEPGQGVQPGTQPGGPPVGGASGQAASDDFLNQATGQNGPQAGLPPPPPPMPRTVVPANQQRE